MKNEFTEVLSRTFMILFEVKYFGPTNYKGSRYRVKNLNTGESCFIGYPHGKEALKVLEDAGFYAGLRAEKQFFNSYVVGWICRFSDGHSVPSVKDIAALLRD